MTIITLSALKIIAALVAPTVVIATLIARSAEPIDRDLW